MSMFSFGDDGDVDINDLPPPLLMDDFNHNHSSNVNNNEEEHMTTVSFDEILGNNTDITLNLNNINSYSVHNSDNNSNSNTSHDSDDDLIVTNVIEQSTRPPRTNTSSSRNLLNNNTDVTLPPELASQLDALPFHNAVVCQEGMVLLQQCHINPILLDPSLNNGIIILKFSPLKVIEHVIRNIQQGIPSCDGQYCLHRDKLIYPLVLPSFGGKRVESNVDNPIEQSESEEDTIVLSNKRPRIVPPHSIDPALQNTITSTNGGLRFMRPFGDNHTDNTRTYEHASTNTSIHDDEDILIEAVRKPLSGQAMQDFTNNLLQSLQSPRVDQDVSFPSTDDILINQTTIETPVPNKESLKKHECGLCCLVYGEKNEDGATVEPCTTKCGHVYCSKCLRRTVSLHHNCPSCRKPATLHDLIKLHL